MARFYHGSSEIQGSDGLQTLILMNPTGYVGYPDTNPSQPPQPGNFVFLNSATAANTLNNANLTHAPPSQTQQFVGIPFQPTPSTTISSSSQDPRHDISALQSYVYRSQYNMYNPVELTEARDITRSQQGLSLTLSSQQPGYRSLRSEREIQSQGRAPTISPASNGDEVAVSGALSPSASGVSNGVNGMLLNSKYLKAAQELLNEVVNVGKGVNSSPESDKGANRQSKTVGNSPTAATETGLEKSDRCSADLTTAERQEIQMKKGKLINMLEEVEQRYRQYHQQMQIVITWFEQVTGIGSAKTYTALALQTISKQFRCLKDAILGQIRIASKSLGEEEIIGGKGEGSKLKFVDNQIRQQRALQQLGMIQHNAWRPQRGLPERAVSVLRAWLFEHFLHPYPKDSDKIMLAKQTGLTRSQVSNWFINARVRLWKPMVEEMYTEEMKEQEQNGSEDKTNKSEQNEDITSKSNNEAQEKSPSLENQNRNFKHENITAPALAVTVASNSTTGICHNHCGINMQNPHGFNLMGSSEMDSITQGSPKKSRSNEMLHSPTSVQSIYMDANNGGETNRQQEAMKYGNEGQNRDGFTLIGGPTNFMGAFGSYPIGEIGSRFGVEQFPAAPYSGSNGNVSLTLGLQHCDNLSISGTHNQTFLPNQTIQLGRDMQVVDEPNEFSAPMSSPHSTNVYENFNIQNRKRLAAQLLPDFVA